MNKSGAFTLAITLLLMLGCAPIAPADPQEEGRTDALLGELEARRVERRAYRDNLSGAPRGPESSRYSAEIMRLNLEVTRLERALDFPLSEPTSTDPSAPAPIMPGGLTSLDRAKLAQRDFSEFVSRAKEGLTSGFKDPFTAQFRGLYIGHSGSVPALCGEVNGKNSYGGYVGFRKFVASESGQYVLDTEPNTIFVFAERRWCADRLKDAF